MLTDKLLLGLLVILAILLLVYRDLKDRRFYAGGEFCDRRFDPSYSVDHIARFSGGVWTALGKETPSGTQVIEITPMPKAPLAGMK